MHKVKLNLYNDQYQHKSFFKRGLWYFTSLLFFRTLLPFPSSFKSYILKKFGAKIGQGVVIKPDVNITFPWLLEIGNYCWIGENVWIDNIALVKLEDNVVLSQGAYILTGSHNYKKIAFDLLVGVITLESGVWIGAKAIVCPGVTCKSHSILSVGSIATGDLEPYVSYQGNPAQKKRKREIEN